MTDFTFIGTHVTDLASGRTVEPGEQVTLSNDDQNEPHNAALIEDGQLVPVEAQKSGGKKKEGDG